MQHCRITKRSNDGISKISALVCGGLAFAFLVAGASFLGSDRLIAILAITCGAFFAVVAIVRFRGLFSPYDLEFVMEEDHFRFGRADQPNEQRMIRRSEIQCLVLDSASDPSLCVHCGGPVAFHLAPGVIEKASQMDALAEAVRENWKDVPVHDREAFQGICKGKAHSWFRRGW